MPAQVLRPNDDVGALGQRLDQYGVAMVLSTINGTPLVMGDPKPGCPAGRSAVEMVSAKNALRYRTAASPGVQIVRIVYRS